MAETDPMIVNKRRKYINKIWGVIEMVPSKKIYSLMKKKKHRLAPQINFAHSERASLQKTKG